jgi:hypothetical protein
MRQPERQKLCSRTPMAVKVGTSCCIRGPESMRLVAVEVLSEALRDSMGLRHARRLPLG